MASPLSTTGRRTLLAGIGAAASLVTAVLVLALMGPGFLDFDADPRAPADASASGSLPFDEAGTEPAANAASGSPSGSASADASGTGSSSGPTPSPAPSGSGRVEQGPGAGGGIGTVAARPVARPGGPRDLPPGHADPGPGTAESVARGVQEAGGTAGRASESLGSSASGHLSELNPFVGEAAERTGAASGEGAREVGDAAGGAVRDLAPPPQTLE